MTNTQLIEKFYIAFSQGNAMEMIACYHDDIVFNDPAFGKLTGDRAKHMWKMLLSQKDAAPKVTYSNIKSFSNEVSAQWRAEYFYGSKKRKVVNEVNATFTFRDGKIHTHTDTFNLWKWSRQALGPVGLLIGWTPMMKSKIQAIANGKLDSSLNERT